MFDGALFKNFKKTRDKYNKNNIFICKNATTDEIATICLIIGVAIYGILIKKYLFSATILILIHVFAVARRSNLKTIKLERDTFSIKYYNKEELNFNIHSIDIRYETLAGRTKKGNLHITSNEGKSYKIYITNQVHEDVISLVHLVNYLKNNQFKKSNDFTYDDFLVLNNYNS